jgi:hypothetical protein
MFTPFVDKRTYIEYQAKKIGHIAFKALSKDQKSSVIGKTSRGIFIRTSSRWVIFISFESYCGPLTISLAQTPDRLQLVKAGEAVRILSGKLVFASAGVVISARDSVVWRQSLPLGPACSFPERLDSLRRFAKEAIADRGNQGLSALLPLLMDLPLTGTASREQRLAFSEILQIRHALRTNMSDIKERLCGFLGVGQGLTPSGDDFVVGLLLVLNRWGNMLMLASDLQQLNQRIVEAAYRKTTTLSANLIECAAFGESDERLLNAADCIVTGKPRKSECISDLLGWGASSGADALVGMAVALTS